MLEDGSAAKGRAMLHNLIVLDVLYNKRMFLIFGGILVLVYLFYPLLMDEPKVITVFCLFYLGILPAMSLGRMHRFRTATMTCSLPVIRRKVVQSKYMVSVGFCVAGIVLFLLVMAVNPMLRFPRAQVFEHQTICTGIFALAVMMSVLSPLILRFGVMGIVIIMVGLQILGTVVLLLASRAGSGFRSALDATIGGVGGAFAFLRSVMGQPGYSLFLVAAGGLLIYLSYLASAAAFERKEL